MGIFKRNRMFLFSAVLVLVVGAVLFGGVVAVRVLASSGETAVTPTPAPTTYNSVSSYGMTGYAPLTIEPTAETPSFITKRLDEGRGIVLLVYVQGASDDMEMLSYFNDIKHGDGQVAQLYTGWIGFKVMEQEVADAVRGL